MMESSFLFAFGLLSLYFCYLAYQDAKQERKEMEEFKESIKHLPQEQQVMRLWVFWRKKAEDYRFPLL